MRVLILFLLLAMTAQAGVLPKTSKYKLDWALYEQWVSTIKPQKFPILPPDSKKLDMNVPEDPKKRPRYIFHLQVTGLTGAQQKDGNNWYVAYNVKGIGGYILMVHPDLMKCLKDAKKKFTHEMQWVVFPHEKLGKAKVIALESPRQCTGHFSTTGGKLKNPIEKK